MKIKIDKNFINSLLAALLFSSTIFFFSPAYVYLNNTFDFQFILPEIIPWLTVLTIISTAVIALICGLAPFRISKRITIILIAISFLIWLQGNIIGSSSVSLNEGEMNLSSPNIYGYLEIGLWILLLITALIKTDYIYKYVKNISLAFIVIQAIVLVVLIIQSPQEPSIKRYSIDNSNKFVFSKQKNVIILVLDSFQSDIFQEIISKDNYYKNIFKGFTYFKNSLGGYPSTVASVPLFLTGQYYDNSIPFIEYRKQSFLSDSSVTKILKSNNCKTEVYFPATYVDENTVSNITKKDLSFFKNINTKKYQLLKPDLANTTMLRYLPFIFKKVFYDNQIAVNLMSDDLIFSKKIKSDVSTDDSNCTFKYYHLRGAHAPYIMDENLNLKQNKTGRDAYIKQAKGSLKITESMLNALKEKNIYDNSMILVIGDHGSQRSEIQIPSNLIDPKETPRITTSAMPLILIKPFNAKGDIKTSMAPVSLSDIPKTIFAELNLINKATGLPMFQINPNQNRERKFLTYDLRTFDYQHFADMEEFMVSGFSWINSSWNRTYRHFLPGKTTYIWPAYYEYGTPILFGKSGNADIYKKLGWHAPENDYDWTDNRYASLMIMAKKTDSDLILKIKRPNDISQIMLKNKTTIISINNKPIGRWYIAGSKEYKVVIPKEYTTNQTMKLTLETPAAASPASLKINDDNRVLGIPIKSLTLSQL